MMEAVPLDVYPLIDRSKMPQIDFTAYTDMLIFLGARGLTFSAGYLDPSELKLHQEINVAVARQLPDDVLKRPILLSIGNFVLDGDHRSYRHYLDKTPVPYIRLHAMFHQAVKLLFEFPGTYESTAENKRV